MASVAQFKDLEWTPEKPLQCPRCSQYFAKPFDKRQHFFCFTSQEKDQLKLHAGRLQAFNKALQSAGLFEAYKTGNQDEIFFEVASRISKGFITPETGVQQVREIASDYGLIASKVESTDDAKAAPQTKRSTKDEECILQ